MKRPGEPKSRKPGGKALERVKQFRLARGLPDKPPADGDRDTPKTARRKRARPRRKP